MNLISRRPRLLVVATLLAVCSPIALGQTNPQTPPKRQARNALQILSPTRGADFSGYGRDLMVSIKRNWIVSMPESFYSGETGMVVIRVQVQADGTFLNADPKGERSSDKDALDAAAVAAVRAAVSFPHFPTAFDGATIELRITFYYDISVKRPDPILVPGKSDAGGEPPK
jgi:TonB family protein